MRALSKVFGVEKMKRVESSRVLVVGAGGIGSELLKNLAMSGFKHIEVIDLDTIEVSNLNRQFLFRRKHVGMSKSKVASTQVLEFADAAIDTLTDSSKKSEGLLRIVSHLGNVKSSEFGQEFFGSFDVVLNALDNVSARRHVNRLCLSLKKPFVESGTRGYLGQTLTIVPGLTACWECTASNRSEQKTYAVCTIRSTPELPVHCIVWAKMLFALIFGPKDAHSDLRDLNVSRSDGESVEDYANRLTKYLFTDDILEQVSMEEKWKSRTPPIALDIASLQCSHLPLPSSLSDYSKMNVLPISHNVAIFKLSIAALVLEQQKLGAKAAVESDDGKEDATESVAVLDFDKDNSAMIAFVSSGANLRMNCYHIETQSEFCNKGIAGNIVHAIATSNAIVAANIVVHAMNILTMPLPSILTDVSAFSESKRTIEYTTAPADDSCAHRGHHLASASSRRLVTRRMRDCGLHNGWLNVSGPKWLQCQVVEAANRHCAVCQHMPRHLVLDLRAADALSKCKEESTAICSSSAETTEVREVRGSETVETVETTEVSATAIRTFGEFRKVVLVKSCGMIDPSVTVECADDIGKSRYIESRAEADDNSDSDDYESDASGDAFVKLDFDSLALTHSAIGFGNGVRLRATDCAQDLTLEWILHDRVLSEETHPRGFEIQSTFDASQFPAAVMPKTKAAVDAKGKGKCHPQMEQRKEDTVSAAVNLQNERPNAANRRKSAAVTGVKRKASEMDDTSISDLEAKNDSLPATKKRKRRSDVGKV